MSQDVPLKRVVGGVRIGNRAVEPAEPWLLTVTEPATGETLAEVVGGGSREAMQAVAEAATAASSWAETSPTIRAAMLRDIAIELRRDSVRDELATLITRETGKRLIEARSEVLLAAGYFDWFANAISTRRGELWDAVPGVRHEVTKRPLGVVAVLTPWNFPLSIPARKIAPALAAGCPVLFKPSEIAPLSGLLLAGIIETFVTAGVVNTVVGDAKTVASTWIEDQRVRGLTFTGSTRVGRALAAQAGTSLMRCVFELGGNAPFIVLDDADIIRAVDSLAIAKYRNNGQSCIAANRVWVPRRILDDFIGAFAAVSEALVLGNPLEDATTLGALALPTDVDRLSGLLTDAEQRGATVLPSRVKLPMKGTFAQPRICIDPAAEARLVTDEIFGPVCSITGYDDVAEVLASMRQNPFGLAGYVVGRDVAAATDVARALDVGIVGVNNAAPNTPQIPFTGLKLSGVGAEGGDVGLDAFLTDQSIAIVAG